MCGYIVISNKNISKSERTRKARNALALLAHRGPDEGAIYDVSDVSFGHRRLSIIDIKNSHQPMSDPSGRYTLVYNGEIYNFNDVREKFCAGWNFKSNGDTEVILAGLIQNGTSILNELEGMWSLAFWDNYEKKLIVARDRMGKKPAYYFMNNDEIIVSSELPALISCLHKNNLNEDLSSTADYLKHGFYLPGTTAYKNINEVLPGHTLTWKQGTNIKSECFWSLNIKRFIGSKSDACNLFYELLTDSVRKRMIADVEVGAFLSGGIDSSLIVSIMNNVLGINPKTFTIKFKNSGYDESRYAKLVSDANKTSHFEKEFTHLDSGQLKYLLKNHIGQPFGDSSLLPTYLVCKVASEHVKVALSGDGADELFSGYQRYQARSILKWYTRLPSGLRASAEKLLRKLPDPYKHHSNSLLKKAHLFLDISDQHKSNQPYVAPMIYDHATFLSMAPDLHNLSQNRFKPHEFSEIDDINEMMLSDIHTYLPQDILQKVDRASMANSLETRAPFLDKRVVEFAFSLPHDWHRNNFSGKKMIYQTFHSLLPKKIWSRRKQGFSVPVGEWFRGDLGHELEELIESVACVINKNFALSLYKEHTDGVRDHGQRLWNLYSYYIWKESM